MAKKTHIKVRLVPEINLIAFFYYVKKPAGGEKAKVKLKAKKYNPDTRKHEVFVEKNFHLIANNYFFLKFLFRNQCRLISYFSIFFCYYWINIIFN